VRAGTLLFMIVVPSSPFSDEFGVFDPVAQGLTPMSRQSSHPCDQTNSWCAGRDLNPEHFKVSGNVMRIFGRLRMDERAC
jgi:hypothetical protein